MERTNPRQDQPITPESPPVKPVNSVSSQKIVLIFLSALVLVGLSSLGTYLFVKSQASPQMPVTSPTPTVQNSLTPTPNSIANWKTYKNIELQYEFQYPPNPLEPQRMEENTSFVIGYFINGGNPNSFQDVQNPDKTYWISLEYISQTQLDLMGITYCGAHSDDSSRCETITIGGVSSIIDWNLPVEYTKVNANGKEEKATQIKATVWISHPKEGVVTFELQPVVPKSKETLYQILSSFKFF